ncbi:SPW repeat domain-containing protein, partial [Methylorubrum suomiense]
MSRVDTQAAPSPSGWRTDEILADVLQHAAGTALVLAAWVLVFADQGRAAFSALVPGLVILALTGYNQVRFRPALERAVALAGAWTFLAPFLLGFAAGDAATWAHVVAGGMTAAAAAARLR